jgi:hypothetical protein
MHRVALPHPLQENENGGFPMNPWLALSLGALHGIGVGLCGASLLLVVLIALKVGAL